MVANFKSYCMENEIALLAIEMVFLINYLKFSRNIKIPYRYVQMYCNICMMFVIIFLNKKRLISFL
jgi:hypothetical protein